MSCCKKHGDCNQGRACPARNTRQAFTRYCEATYEPCGKVSQCGHYCDIERANPCTRQGGRRVNNGVTTEIFKPRRWYQSSALHHVLVGLSAVIGFGVWIKSFY